MTESSPLQVLLNTLPQVGQIQRIGVRPSRVELMTELDAVQIDLDKGLEGDRFSGRAGNPRQLMIQAGD